MVGAQEILTARGYRKNNVWCQINVSCWICSWTLGHTALQTNHKALQTSVIVKQKILFMCKNNAFHLVPQVAVNNKLWYSGYLFYVVISDYPFCFFIMKFLRFPSDKANFFLSTTPWILGSSGRPGVSLFLLYIFLPMLQGKKKIYFTAILSVQNRNWSHSPRSSQRAMIGIPLLPWKSYVDSTTFQLRKKLPWSRNKTAATRPAFPFLAYPKTYSQQLYIEFIVHNNGSTGLIMPWEKIN